MRELRSSGEGVWFELRVPCDIDAGEGVCLVLEFDYAPRERSTYLRNGYQSWSYSGRAVVGQEVARPGADMATLSHFSHLDPPLGPSGVESECFVVFEDALFATLDGSQFPACFFTSPSKNLYLSFDLTGAAPREGQRFDLLYARRLENEVGADALAALIDALSGCALYKRARACAPTVTGWCSWYQYFHGVDEVAVLTNLGLASERLACIDVFQIDDGYQVAIGDWLDTNERFPSGLERMAARIADAGFVPGIWLAPFLATTQSSIWREHLDWFTRLPNSSPVPAMLNPAWGGNGFAYALDTTNPEVIEWLKDLGRSIKEMGFGYVKIDFCYAAAMRGKRAEAVGRAEALRMGLAALRRGLEDDVFLLGCGMPLWPAIGLVDGMRIGPDVAPHLGPAAQVHGLTDSMPALVNAWRNTVARAATHRILWTADPDCVLLRRKQTRIPPEIALGWAETVASLGQALIFSDDLSLYERSDFETARRLVEEARQNDLPAGLPRDLPDPLDEGSYATKPARHS